MPLTLMFTILPTVEAGTKHLTEVAESNVVLEDIELESAKSIRQTLVCLLKFEKAEDTVTSTASSRAKEGLNTTAGVGGGGGGGAVDEGGAEDVTGGVGSNSIPN